tara:strand:- start:1725 stop:1997 length:273 start_codon:yes stop_codon:yes gene_type:complete
MIFEELESGQHFRVVDEESPRTYVRMYEYTSDQSFLAVCLTSGKSMGCEDISPTTEVEVVHEKERLLEIDIIDRAEALVLDSILHPSRRE